MLACILIGYGGAFLAPLLYRAAPRAAAYLCAGLPLALFVYFATYIGRTGDSGITTTYPWVPSLGITISLTLDGLSLLFSLIITGIGSLVIFYSSAYLANHHNLGRLYGLLLAFMASMLGLVLARNLIVLYLFWELTSITSYLLIGFDHHYEKSRTAALQALLVTGAGGLALLAGFLMLGQMGGSLEISDLMRQTGTLQAHGLYLPALLLILAGAFTKSAQFPFHFWLPSAMAAPTPVSAYLHSAAMVKAGIYLLARLTPLLGGGDAWHYAITTAGVTTMLAGAVLAFPQEDLKRLLAYSTVSALGTLTLLIGIGTSTAMEAFVVFLLVHVLYKGALFLVAGAVDHAAGTRELNRLGGLWKVIPVVAIAAVLAALSMAGLPPMIGFIGKELLYEAKLQAPQAAMFITTAGVSANVVMVAVAVMLAYRPFFSDPSALSHQPHPVSWKLWLGPALLAVAGMLIGLFPGMVNGLLSPAVGAIRAEPTVVHLALWHGVNAVLLLGMATVAAGGLLYVARESIVRGVSVFGRMPGPDSLYRLLFDSVLSLARLQTRVLQNGYLRFYLKVIIGVAVGLVALALIRYGEAPQLGPVHDVFLHEWLIGGVILAAAIVAASTRSRLAAVTALGAVGYGVALTYLLFGAPDLAMTQFCIETLTVILFVLVLYRLPRFSHLSSRGGRVRDLLISLAGGGVMTLLALLALSQPQQLRISQFFMESSVALAHGRNVVNVILVDFRGLDTLGEITVLAVAGIGIYGLIKFGAKVRE